MTSSYPSFDSVSAGLCARCRHARVVSTARGAHFLLCHRAQTDPQYPRYPRLPVQACRGFEVRAADPPVGLDREKEGDRE